MLGTTRQRLNLIGWLTEPTKANTTPVTSRLSLYMCIGEYITLSGWEWEKKRTFSRTRFLDETNTVALRFLFPIFECQPMVWLVGLRPVRIPEKERNWDSYKVGPYQLHFFHSNS